MNEPIVSADDLARELAALVALARRVGERRDQVQTQLAARLTPGDVKKPSHPLDPRLRLATITYRLGAVRAAVTNRAALDEWVVEHHPEQVDQTWVPADADEFDAYVQAYPGERIVRMSAEEDYADAVVDASKAAGAPCSPHGDLDVPGVSVAVSDPVIAVSVAKDVPDPVWRGLLIQTAEEVTRGE